MAKRAVSGPSNTLGTAYEACGGGGGLLDSAAVVTVLELSPASAGAWVVPADASFCLSGKTVQAWNLLTAQVSEPFEILVMACLNVETDQVGITLKGAARRIDLANHRRGQIRGLAHDRCASRDRLVLRACDEVVGCRTGTRTRTAPLSLPLESPQATRLRLGQSACASFCRSSAFAHRGRRGAHSCWDGRTGTHLVSRLVPIARVWIRDAARGKFAPAQGLEHLIHPLRRAELAPDRKSVV